MKEEKRRAVDSVNKLQEPIKRFFFKVDKSTQGQFTAVISRELKRVDNEIKAWLDQLVEVKR
jgi:hypothetical protein